VWVEYDPKLITYDALVSVFFASHDPTFHASVAYRSIIFYQTPEQLQIANKTLEQVKSQSKLTVWTALKNGTEFIFWPAEDYHQHYIYKMGDKCPDGSDPAPEACPGSQWQAAKALGPSLGHRSRSGVPEELGNEKLYGRWHKSCRSRMDDQ